MSNPVAQKKIQRAFEMPAGAFRALQATAEDIALINQLAPVPLSPEEVVVREGWGFHNLPDRDDEKLSEDLFDDLVRTLPGKSVLWPSATSDSHTWRQPGRGRVFKSWKEEGADRMWGRYAFYYLKEGNEQATKDFNAGIWHANSIGFQFDHVTIQYDAQGNFLFWEMFGPGEAYEMSIVGVGAMQDAGVKSATGHGSEFSAVKFKALALGNAAPKSGEPKEGRKAMAVELLIGQKSYEVEPTEGVKTQEMLEGVSALNAKAEAHDRYKEAIAQVRKELNLEDGASVQDAVKALRVKAIDGEKYRESLVTECLKFAVLAGVLDEKTAEDEKAHLATLSMERLKVETERNRKAYEKVNPAAAGKSLDPNDDADPQGGDGQDHKAKAVGIVERIQKKVKREKK